MDGVESLDPHLFKWICHHVDFALIATNHRLDIVYWNAAAERMFGAGAETMIGQPVTRVFPEDVRTAVEQLMQAAQSGLQAGDVEFTLGGRDGRKLLQTAVISPIVGADGAPQGVSVCVRDITQRREQTRQLGRSRRMASLGHMAGGVAHHFNSILGGITTKLDFLLSTLSPRERHRRDLEQIADAIGRAARISGQLMTFAEGDHDVGFPQD
ncbi:MAG: PAS domain-containing protein, partial [Phycisphaerae bacterium]